MMSLSMRAASAERAPIEVEPESEHLAIDSHEDAQLISAIAHGDSRALEALYDRYSATVFRMAMRILQQRELAEDDVRGEHGAGAEDDAAPEGDALAEDDGGMHEGQELGAAIEQRAHEALLDGREPEAADEHFVGRGAMGGERADGGEGAERREGLRVVVKEGVEGPEAAVIRMLTAPGAHFAAEAAGADDEELLHGVHFW